MAGKGNLENLNRKGRKKGIPNKFTGLKRAFLDAFEATGGSSGLVTWILKSDRNRAVFYNLIARLLPTEVEVGGSPEGSSIRIEIIHVKPEGGNGNGGEKQ